MPRPAALTAAAAIDPHQYALMFEHMHNGFALHRVIVDAAGRPVDYEFLMMNPAYAEMTGLDPAAAVGRRVTEMLPGTERDPVNWIQKFGEVALTGRTLRFEAFSEGVGKWFEVVAYRPDVRQFAVLIHEITERKQLEVALLEAASREQQRLGREMHDGLGQEIMGIAFIAEGLARAATQEGLPNAADLFKLAGAATQAAATCRGIAHGLSPLDQAGGDLRMALRGLVLRHATSAGPSVRLEEVGKARIRLGKRACGHLYRIAQEALGNALRHAGATEIVIRLTARSEFLRLEVEDDGRGYRPTARRGDGIGLQTMAYRARLVGGELEVESRRIGGTRVWCHCPQPVGAPRADAG